MLVVNVLYMHRVNVCQSACFNSIFENFTYPKSKVTRISLYKHAIQQRHVATPAPAFGYILFTDSLNNRITIMMMTVEICVSKTNAPSV